MDAIQKLLSKLRRIITWPDREEEVLAFEDALNEYIDRRIEDALDREFSRGKYSTW